MKDLNKALQTIFPEDLTSKAFCILSEIGEGVPFNIEGTASIIEEIRKIDNKDLREVMLVIVGTVFSLQIMYGDKGIPNFTYADFFHPLCDQ